MPRIAHHGNIRQRSPGSYEVRLSVYGHRHTFTHRGTYTEACSFANTKYAELEAQYARERRGLPGDWTFRELIRRFKAEYLPGKPEGTQRSYSDALKPIAAYFVTHLERTGQRLTVRELRKGHVSAFLTWRRGHTLDGKGNIKTGRVSDRTLQKDRTVLHTLVQFAVNAEVRDGNPVDLIPPPKAKRRTPVILTEDQYERLLAECRRSRQRMLYLYALTLGESGARSESEVLWLRWTDIHLDDGFIWIDNDPETHETKDREGRWVPMSPRLRDAMQAHMATYRMAVYGGRRSPWVFHHTVTRRKHRAGSRILSMRRAFKAAAKRAGLPRRFVQHDLRHRRVTIWLAEGKNPVHVKEAVGHSDLRTTMGYTHLAREHLRSLVEDKDRPGPIAREGQSG